MVVGGQRHVSAAAPQERPGTHCIGGWVGYTAGLDGCWKSRPPPGFDPRTVQPVASRYTDWVITARYGQRVLVFFFIVVTCILITMKFLSPTNAPLYYTYKMLKYTVKISHDCSYMFRSIWTIIREPMPNLARVNDLSLKNIVTLARFGISSLMMVQMDRNM